MFNKKIKEKVKSLDIQNDNLEINNDLLKDQIKDLKKKNSNRVDNIIDLQGDISLLKSRHDKDLNNHKEAIEQSFKRINLNEILIIAVICFIVGFLVYNVADSYNIKIFKKT